MIADFIFTKKFEDHGRQLPMPNLPRSLSANLIHMLVRVLATRRRSLRRCSRTTLLRRGVCDVDRIRRGVQRQTLLRIIIGDFVVVIQLSRHASFFCATRRDDKVYLLGEKVSRGLLFTRGEP